MSKKSLPHLHYNDVQHYDEQAIAQVPSILNIQKSDILTDQDVCEYLQISVKTLRKFCRHDKIPYTRLGGRYYYIRQVFALGTVDKAIVLIFCDIDANRNYHNKYLQR